MQVIRLIHVHEHVHNLIVPHVQVIICEHDYKKGIIKIFKKNKAVWDLNYRLRKEKMETRLSFKISTSKITDLNVRGTRKREGFLTATTFYILLFSLHIFVIWWRSTEF
jgi:hypothetical protein